MFKMIMERRVRNARALEGDVAARKIEKLCLSNMTAKNCPYAIGLLYSINRHSSIDVRIKYSELLVKALILSNLNESSVNYVTIFVLRYLQDLIPIDSEILVGTERRISIEEVDPLLRKYLILMDKDGKSIL